MEFAKATNSLYNEEKWNFPMSRSTRFTQSFLFWYPWRGLRRFFLLAKTLLRFTTRYFHIGGLLRTLFSPWKRDVAFRTWRGFHPLLSLTALFQNLLSRLLGMTVRLAVIFIGIFFWFLLLCLSLILGLLYLGAPLLIGLGFALLSPDPFLGGVSLFSGVLGAIMAFIGYLFREQDDPLIFDVRELCRKKWFRRVLGRLGVGKNSPEREVLGDPERFRHFLAEYGIEQATFERAVLIEKRSFDRRRKGRRFWSWENLRKTIPVGRGWRYAYTPHLDGYCLDLSQHDPTEYRSAELAGRNEELKVAAIVLERPTQNSLFLVGEPGIGKKTFVHHLAHLIRENAFPSGPLAEARVLIFDLGRAISDAASRGEDADNFLRLLFGEAAYAGNVILVIENIDLFLGSDPAHRNIAPMLSEFLGLPAFRIIGTAPTGRYHTLAKTDEQVLKFFETVYLREPSAEETFDILADHFESTERKRVVFTIQGLESVIESAGRYDWTTPFPERAIDLAQEALGYWRGTDEEFITPQTVEKFVMLKTGVPMGEIGEEEKEKLLKLEELLHRRVVGQDEAVREVAEAMRKARVGFGNEKRPLGSFIFLGPSGVGKTETVKAFAESYFGSEDRMIRLDMSEFQRPEAVDRLIGSREKGVQGELVSAIKEKPFSILLLDEIEKAYPKALDIFLQILDEGYVTDGFGEKVSFRSVVIVATSNAGAPLIKRLVAENAPMETIRRQVIDHIVEKNIFRLEFLSRFDGLIFFEPLKRGELEAVAKLKLEWFAERLKKEKNISIDFASDVIRKIVEKGFEPEFGTRSLNRYIEDTIEDAVVKKIISGEVAAGGALTVSADEL